MADSPEVSVIIPTRQRRDALRRALASLARQTRRSPSSRWWLPSTDRPTGRPR